MSLAVYILKIELEKESGLRNHWKAKYSKFITIYFFLIKKIKSDFFFKIKKEKKNETFSSAKGAKVKDFYC